MRQGGYFMIGSALKKFAKRHDMKIARGVAYGSFYGYAATFCEGAGWKRIVVSTRFPEPAKRDAFRTLLAQSNLTTQYRVTYLDIMENGVVIQFSDNPGTMKKIEAFCEWFFPQLVECEATGTDICCECGAPIVGDGCWKLLNTTANRMHHSCANKLKEQLDSEAVQLQKEETGTYARGLVGALIGAVLGAVVWGLVLHLGFMASIVGFLIGFLAEKGYSLLKGRRGKGKVYILAGATIFGVLLGNLGYDAVMWAVEIAKYAPDAVVILNGAEIPVSYGDIPMLIGHFFANDSQYQSAMITNCLMGTAFALLGVWGILRKTKNEITPIKVIDLE